MTVKVGAVIRAKLFDLHGKMNNGNGQKILEDGEWLDMEYIQHCVSRATPRT